MVHRLPHVSPFYLELRKWYYDPIWAQIDARPVVFIHVPKTGGTSIRKMFKPYFHPRTVLRWQLRMHEKCFSNPLPFRFLAAHFQYLEFRSLMGAKAFYFTILRHPVDWAISHWQWTIQEKRQRFRYIGPTEERQLTRKNYLARDGFLPYFTDQMESGVIWRRFGPTPQAAFKNASKLNFLGFFETLEESAEKLWRLAGIKVEFPGIGHHNVNPDRFKYELTAEERCVVEERFKDEIAFYNACKDVWV